MGVANIEYKVLKYIPFTIPIYEFVTRSYLTAIGLIILTYFLLFIYKTGDQSIKARMNEFGRNLKDAGNSALRRMAPNSNYFSNIDEQILQRGGYVGGLLNDGNFCFMNSVIQSLASSKELLKFLDDEIIGRYESLEKDLVADEDSVSESNEQNGKKQKASNGKVYGKSKKKHNRSVDNGDNDTEPDIQFTIAFKELLDKLNYKYYKERPYFKTNSMVNKMSNSPKKSMLMAYDQEDAQEFFQTILSELEKNIKTLESRKDDKTPVPAKNLSEDDMIGQAHLGRMGTVYIPSEQIDPNSYTEGSTEKSFTPFKLVTPLDGITAERIGCLQCGENGGIRYSVFSGLSLNLPSENIGSTLKLSSLLNEWIKPEIIEGVECNRCALEAVREHLLSQMKEIDGSANTPAKLVDAMRTRLAELEETLKKPVIDDDDYKKLHTENMVRKCSKSKQVVISRPPALLSIHINRSVFDPRTYMIRKNNSRVLFKSRMNLEPWCCDIDEINLDARLPMSKKQKVVESSEDENIGGDYYSKLHQKFEKAFEDEDEEEYDDEDEEYNNGIYESRNVSEYDPLNGELSSDYSEEDEISSDEEVDALGNTIPKKKTVTLNDGSLTEISVANGNIVDGDGNEDNSENEDDDDDDDDGDENYTDNDAEDDEAVDSDESNRSQDAVQAPPINLAPRYSTVNPSPLTYALRSVIVHYGTHNYGHYIAYRKFRGVWWRISDESVYVVDEAEVLSTPGVFMLFYEYDYDEKTGRMKDDIEYEFQLHNAENGGNKNDTEENLDQSELEKESD
ncbi:uncharacterized protein GVI51_H10483 [Nakaseomyces glabratus]|uniref:Ubiquitin carboxyl-terminal hydrolase n=1 Tax=Candida glabrata (strain ATCC 2001 / BCRC 20586 / JCM 3761 / NBRC 0622 / NRRL Y-65 / CBS 138) TaxID=284593 RepID=Q6FR86_CANGA|nr:uncharacterized protein CAGL0H10582g [Nakaseomyces glabratus]KAH7588038.1 Ubiquitin specific protease (USP) domain signature 1 [Nakaseomyces glabratus]KAH7592424.1 Ubiquitin specific protease (USP) domain signature 1 [Nakaseomyces glabratus]KAH7601690.1 Ubiquitin specific protease (USP) domain signature 1 [Nakaseomyces glabratus]KAH7606070.1 Ubiquitin specific protease (USP) domain signature 1 [Nakaseomyces glabratus]KTB12685.1 Ubiquitin carboxyl-terminal hydrolase 1 [Nakaseomyces glabratus|eukprot:XP_447258.1 uncharacterized protein CAGL0H10582g [[Candida] glabrata]